MRWLAIVVLIGCGGASATLECAEGELTCDGACVDPQTDAAHCGDCGNACESGEVCSAGACIAACAAEELACGGACIDPLTDSAHCGDCGVACGADQECRAGACQARCEVGLTSPISDPWGAQWDGVERPAATLDAASAACAAFGARLPHPSELYRVSAARSGAVGNAATVAQLWSGAPATRTAQTVVRLSDGTANELAVTAPQAFRCVCPPPQPAGFSGARCFGPPAQPCFAIASGNIDTDDRVAIRRSSAIWECAQEKAHLADAPALIAAIFEGAPGSGTMIATADQSSYSLSTILRWTSALGWVAQGNVSHQSLASRLPFRCTGTAVATGTHPAPVLNEFVAPGGRYKSDAMNAPAASWATAHDACAAKGGHLPRAAELVELIQQGLPNGTNTSIWTSDQLGYSDDAGFLAAVLAWPDTDPRYPYEYEANRTTWELKNGSYPYRCVYYPIDPAFQPPATCNSACFEIALTPGPARMVFDAVDRPAARLGDASARCAAEGGRLASERDLTEAIRRGLPNGSNEELLTSDLGQTNVTVVRWSGVNPGFTDQYPTFMSWAGLTQMHPYRCMWTNEVR